MAEETLKLFIRLRDDDTEGLITTDSRTVHLQKANDTRQLQVTGLLQSNDNQDKVYETIGKRSVEKFLEGYSSMFFLYGANQTGKTFTLLGDESHFDTTQIGGQGYLERGLIVRAMQQIFRKAKAQQKQKEFKVYCSCIEVSKVKIADLSLSNCKTRLRIQQNNLGWFTAVNLHYTHIKDMESFAQYFREILSLREYTNSHLVFQINLVQLDILNQDQEPVQSYITFVQLGFIMHTEQFEEQEQILTELNSLTKVLSKLNNLESIDHGFKESRLTKILKQSICNSENITVVGTFSKSNSYIDNCETLNFLKMTRDPDSVSLRVFNSKSRQSIKLRERYDVASGSDKDEAQSYGISSVKTIIRKESHLQLAKQNQPYDRTQYLLNQKAENEEIIKKLQQSLNQLREMNEQVDARGKSQKDKLNNNIISLKSTMKKMKEDQTTAIKATIQKYQKFLQQQALNCQQNKANIGESRRIMSENPLSFDLNSQHRRNIKNVFDSRDQLLNSMKKQHLKEISILNQKNYETSLKVNPLNQLVYKESLREIRELDRIIKEQQKYIKNIDNHSIDKFKLMQILNNHKYKTKNYDASTSKMIEMARGITDLTSETFKEKANDYLKSQMFALRRQKEQGPPGPYGPLRPDRFF